MTSGYLANRFWDGYWPAYWPAYGVPVIASKMDHHHVSMWHYTANGRASFAGWSKR